MNVGERLPVWQCNSPPSSPDSSGDFDGFRSPDKSDSNAVTDWDSQISTDNGMPATRSSGREIVGPKYRDAYRLNNNVSDSGECDVEKCNADRSRRGTAPKRRAFSDSSDEERERDRVKRRKSLRERRNGRAMTDNVVCGISSECVTGTVGGDDDDDDDDGDDERERSPRRQTELARSEEINKRDVIKSRDVTSNPSAGSKRLAEDGRRGTCGEAKGLGKGSCSAGSYSRRKHHKHHKHKSEEEEPVSPRVNPIFLWVRQDDTRIVEVMCEDYDHRNRIRLTRTHLGWRAIPKTERFAAAIIPKAPPAFDEEVAKRRHRRKGGKRRKAKRRKAPVPDCARERSVNAEEDQNPDSEVDSKNRSTSNSDYQVEEPPQSPSAPLADIHPELKALASEPSFRLTRSFSCDFSHGPEYPGHRHLARSRSVDPAADVEIRLDSLRSFRVQNQPREDATEEAEAETSTPVPDDDPLSGVKTGDEDITKEDAKTKSRETEPEESLTPEVVDITKRDPDLNDADCDELGRLLKDIPDLEFPEETEEADEDEEEEGKEAEDDEEWSVPRDLSVPKTRTEESECPPVKLPVLPPNISSLVTVTSTTRPPEPLTAPLPEVTITPIPNPNPKPAHQQKSQNKFLESLLSSPYPIKPEKDETTVTRSSREKRPADDDQRSCSEADRRSKKMVLEDITLKSLLSRQHTDRSVKGLELENHIRKMKSKQESENLDVSKSRLHELLTEGPSTGGPDPIAQLKQVLSNPDLAVPDPLLVPRARLPALVASPASEIPRLLTMHLDKKVEETPCPPLTDSDMLEVSLSNLRSLLSCKTDKVKSADAEDLASYHKSLETLLDWQRYQKELMEAHMKNSSLAQGLSPSDIDVATATALNQMLWLPYLELSCNSNAMASPVSSMFAHNYALGSGLPSLPHISTNHFAQSSPFLTPTSPMDVDAQMKTLAMWQEAVVSQQNANHSRKVPTALLSSTHHEARGRKTPNASSNKQRPGPAPSPQQTKNRSQCSPHAGTHHKTHFTFDPHYHQQQQEAFLRQQYEMQRKQQKQRSQEHHRSHHHQQQQQDCEKKVRGSISVKPLSNLLDKANRHCKKQSWQQFEQDLRKRAELTNEMTIRWQRFEDEMRRSHHARDNKRKDSASWNRTGQATADKPPDSDKPSEPAKLKVKNLVDPNMSPPKLLKQAASEDSDEVAPIQDDSQAHLWHPLFGSSNQMKTQQYNSPWRWTTVTVNGE